MLAGVRSRPRRDRRIGVPLALTGLSLGSAAATFLTRSAAEEDRDRPRGVAQARPRRRRLIRRRRGPQRGLDHCLTLSSVVAVHHEQLAAAKRRAASVGRKRRNAGSTRRRRMADADRIAPTPGVLANRRGCRPVVESSPWTEPRTHAPAGLRTDTDGDRSAVFVPRTISVGVHLAGYLSPCACRPTQPCLEKYPGWSRAA